MDLQSKVLCNLVIIVIKKFHLRPLIVFSRQCKNVTNCLIVKCSDGHFNLNTFIQQSAKELIMNTPLVALLTSLTIVASGCAYAAQESSMKIVCDRTEAVVDFLKKRHGESLIAAGRMSDSKGVTTLWVNSDTKSWTVVTTKNNQSCIVLDGDKFMVNDGNNPSSTTVPQNRGPVQQISG